MTATDIPHASLVMGVVEQGTRLLEMGATEKAFENFRTAVMMNSELVSELLSDDEKVAKRAAKRRPPDTDLLTYAASPLRHFYRLLLRRGEVSRLSRGSD